MSEGAGSLLELLITGDAEGLKAALGESITSLKEFGDHAKEAASSVGEFALGITLAEAAIGSFKEILESFKEGISGINSELDLFGIQIAKVMGGDLEAAQGHILALRDVARGEIFDLADLAHADRIMRNLGGTALDTAENIEKFSDAAEATNNGLSTVSDAIARMYGFIQEGQPIGRVTLQLQRLGIVNQETIQEMNKMQKAGAAANDIWNVFSESLDKFKPAAEESGKTLEHAATLIQRNIGYLSSEVFQPFYTLLKDGANVIAQALASETIQEWSYKAAGAVQLVVEAVRALLPSVQSAGEGLTGFMEGLGRGFIDLVNFAAKWGADFVKAFAEGMAGALNLVVEVVNTLAEILTYWMAPGSPPRMLPFVDKWGLNVAEQFLRGMTEVDVSAINTLSKEIEQELRDAFAIKGGFNLEDSVMNMRASIVEAVHDVRTLGEVSVETWARIHEATAPIGDDIDRQIQLYIDLADAQNRVADATQELKDLQDQYNDAIRPIDQAINKLQTQERIMRAQHELGKALENQAKGKDPGGVGVAEAQLKMQILQQQILKDQTKLAYQDQIDAATDKLAAAKKQEDIDKKQIDQLKGVNDWIQANIKLVEQFNKVSAGGGGGAKAGGDNKFIDFLDDLEKNKERLKTEKDNLVKAFNEMKTAFEPAVKAAEGLIPALNDVGTAIHKAWEELTKFKEAWDQKQTRKIDPENIDQALGATPGTGKLDINPYTEFVNEVKKKLAEIGEFFAPIGESWANMTENMGKNWVKRSNEITAWWKANSKEIETEFYQLGLVWNIVCDIIRAVATAAFTGVRGIILIIMDFIAGDVDQMHKDVELTFKGLTENIGNLWNDLWKDASFAFNIFKTGFKNALDEIARWIAETFKFPSIPNPFAPKDSGVKNKDGTPADTSGLGDTHIAASATGTDFFSSGWTRINEKGSEIVQLPTGSKVFNASRSAEMLSKAVTSQGSIINHSPTYNIHGGDPEEIKNTIARATTETLEVFRDQVVKLAGRS